LHAQTPVEKHTTRFALRCGRPVTKQTIVFWVKVRSHCACMTSDIR